MQLLEIDLNDLSANMDSYNLDFQSELIFDFINNFDAANFLSQLKKKQTHIQEELMIKVLSILIITKPEEENFYYELKEVALRNIKKYTNAERLIIFTKLKNYCILRVKSGRENFHKEKFLLHKAELESVKFKVEGVGPLTTISFLSVVSYGIEFNEVEFVENFIERFTEKLYDSRKETMYNLVKSMLEFEKGNFEKTLEHLSKVDQFSVPVKNICKELYLKSYFELSLIEQAHSALDSYSHYIREKPEFSDSKKEKLFETYNLFHKLFKMKSEPDEFDEFDIKKFIKEIDLSGISSKKWFLKKTSELKKKG